MATRYITISAFEKRLFPIEKIQKNVYHYAFVNIHVRKESNGEFAFIIIIQNMLFLEVFFLFLTIVKCALLCTVITLHHANLFPKRIIKSRSHPLWFTEKVLLIYIWISLCFISPRQRLGDIKHTTRFIIHRMEWKFISDSPIHCMSIAGRNRTLWHGYNAMNNNSNPHEIWCSSDI